VCAKDVLPNFPFGVELGFFFFVVLLLSFSLLEPFALDTGREQLVGAERRLPQNGEVLSFGVVFADRCGEVKEARWCCARQ